MGSGMQDYNFAQAHRKASEAYIGAQGGKDSEKEWILSQLDEADRFGRLAFDLASNSRQRVGEYNFLVAVAGLRITVELGYEITLSRPLPTPADTKMFQMFPPTNEISLPDD